MFSRVALHVAAGVAWAPAALLAGAATAKLWPQPEPAWQVPDVGVKGKAALAVALFGLASAAVIVRISRKKVVHIRPLAQESVITGSQEMAMFEASCQATLAYEAEDGSLVAVGSGVRMQVGSQDLLVTAAHNLPHIKILWLLKRGERYKVGLLHDCEMIPLAADAAAILLPSKPFSVLGVKVASLAPMPATRAAVSITGIAGKGTTGTLSVINADHHAFGHVQYSATTMGGYSGAPYMSGNSMYGLHTHGGARNGGYEALYLYSLARSALGYVEEATEDAFLSRLFSTDDPEYKVQEVGDKVILRTEDAKYHVFDRKKFQEYEDRWQYSIDEEEYVEESAEPALNCRGPGVSSRDGDCIQCWERSQERKSVSSRMTQYSSPWRKPQRGPPRKSKKRSNGQGPSSPPPLAPSTSGTRSTASQLPVQEQSPAT